MVGTCHTEWVPVIDDTATPPTLYEVLGVDRTAPPYMIEAAYKAQLRQHHPDRVDPHERAAAEEHVKHLADIRDLLCNPAKRAAYDATLRPTGHIRATTSASGSTMAATSAPWPPPSPTPFTARAAAGAAAVLGPVCVATFVLALLVTTPVATAVWVLGSLAFGIAVGLAEPALPKPTNHTARVAFAVALSPVTGVLYLPALSRAALGHRPTPVRA